MDTTNFTISKTGKVGLITTTISTDQLGSLVIDCSTTNSNKLSVQAAGTFTSVTVGVSNDGINYVPYTQLRNTSAVTVPTITAAGLYVRGSEMDYFAYMRFTLVGINDTFLLTVRGIY